MFSPINKLGLVAVYLACINSVQAVTLACVNTCGSASDGNHGANCNIPGHHWIYETAAGGTCVGVDSGNSLNSVDLASSCELLNTNSEGFEIPGNWFSNDGTDCAALGLFSPGAGMNIQGRTINLNRAGFPDSCTLPFNPPFPSVDDPECSNCALAACSDSLPE